MPRILAGLKHFRHRRHEVIVFHVLDPAEIEFPFRDPTLFKGLEGMPDVLTEPHALRRAYQAEIGAFLDEMKKGCRMIDIDYVPAADRPEPGRAAVELPGRRGHAHASRLNRVEAAEHDDAGTGGRRCVAICRSCLGPRASPIPPLLYGLGRGVGADHHPPAEPPQVPRDALGGDAVPAGGDPEELSGGSGSSSGSCWPSGR